MFIQHFKKVKWPGTKKIAVGLVWPRTGVSTKDMLYIAASLQQSGARNKIQILSFLTSVHTGCHCFYEDVIAYFP